MSIAVTKFLSSANINLVIGVVGIILLLIIPNLIDCPSCNFDAYETSKLSTSVNSIKFSSSGVALLVSACPMALDLILDVISSSEFISIKLKQCLIGRAAITIVTILFGLQIALKSDYFHIWEFYGISYFFGLWCMRIIFVTSLAFCLCIIDPSIFTVQQTSFISFVTTITGMIRFYGTSSQVNIITVLNNVLTGLFAIVFLSIWCFWLYKVLKLNKKLSVENYASLYILFLLIFIYLSCYSTVIYAWIHDAATYSLLNSNTDILVVQVYAQTIICVIMSIVPGRIARKATIAAKDDIIQAKQAYVCYVSHELRTPLNTVYMGLTLSIDQIPADTTNPIEMERRSTLKEIWYACEVALEILNDLLLYDKLQNGLVSLTKENVLIIEFISRSISMFSVQLRSKTLRLTFTTSNNNHPPNRRRRLSLLSSTTRSSTNSKYNSKNNSHNHIYSLDSGINMNDLIFHMVSELNTIQADKLKLGQVFRNLLSNAIKFTPDGGEIQVTVQFMFSPLNNDDDDDDDDESSDRNHHRVVKGKPRSYRMEVKKWLFHHPSSSINIAKNDDDDDENENDAVYGNETNVSKMPSISPSSSILLLWFYYYSGGGCVYCWKSLSKFVICMTNGMITVMRRFLSFFFPSSSSSSSYYQSPSQTVNSISPDVITDVTHMSENTTSLSLTPHQTHESSVTHPSPRADNISDISSYNHIHNDHHHNDSSSTIDMTKNRSVSSHNKEDIQTGSKPNSCDKKPYDCKSIDEDDDEDDNDDDDDDDNNNNNNDDDVKPALSSRRHSFYSQQSVGESVHTAATTTSTQHGMLIIEVKDSGVGMNPDDQKRLFTEKVQFNPEVLQGGGGSGLGLFITKGLVDLHGGKISLHSEGEGKGTMFRIEIPMTRTTELESRNITTGHPSVVSGHSGSKMSFYKRSSRNFKHLSELINNGSSSSRNSSSRGNSSRRNNRRNSAASSSSNNNHDNNKATNGSNNTIGCSSSSNSNNNAVSSSNRHILNNNNNTTGSSSSNNNNNNNNSVNSSSNRHILNNNDNNNNNILYNSSSNTIVSSYKNHHSSSKITTSHKVLGDWNFKHDVINTSSDTPSLPLIAKTDELISSSSSAAAAAAVAARIVTQEEVEMKMNDEGGHSYHNSQLCLKQQQEDDEEEEVEEVGESKDGFKIGDKVVLTAVNSSSNDNNDSNVDTNSTTRFRSISNQPYGQSTSKCLYLLIVDDSGLNRKMLRRLLEAQGHVCEEAADGLIAVNMMKNQLLINNINNNSSNSNNNNNSSNNSNNNSNSSSNNSNSSSNNRYDSIIMDYNMPNMNGPTAATEIRKLGYAGSIIGVTGNFSDKDKDMFMKAGASHVFTKPLDIGLMTAVFNGIK